MNQQTNGHPFPKNAPGPRERPEPTRRLVVAVEDGDVLHDLEEPTNEELLSACAQRGLLHNEGLSLTGYLASNPPTLIGRDPQPATLVEAKCETCGRAHCMMSNGREVWTTPMCDCQARLAEKFGQSGNPERDPRLTYADETGTAPAVSADPNTLRIWSKNNGRDIVFGRPGAQPLFTTEDSEPANVADADPPPKPPAFVGLNHLAGRLGVLPNRLPAGQWGLVSETGHAYDPIALLSKILDRCDELAGGLFEHQKKVAK